MRSARYATNLQLMVELLGGALHSFKKWRNFIWTVLYEAIRRFFVVSVTVFRAVFISKMSFLKNKINQRRI